MLVLSGVIRLVVDDTLGRQPGKRIAAASMHRDPGESPVSPPTFLFSCGDGLGEPWK